MNTNDAIKILKNKTWLPRLHFLEIRRFTVEANFVFWVNSIIPDYKINIATSNLRFFIDDWDCSDAILLVKCFSFSTRTVLSILRILRKGHGKGSWCTEIGLMKLFYFFNELVILCWVKRWDNQGGNNNRSNLDFDIRRNYKKSWKRATFFCDFIPLKRSVSFLSARWA